MRVLDPRVLLCSLLSGAFLVAEPARADDAAPGATPPVTAAAPDSVSHWYGGRLLLSDGASLAVFAAGGAQENVPLIVLGLGGLILGSPIIHTAHAGPGHGALSLALRLGLPGLGFLLAKSASDGCWRELGASDTCDVGAQIEGVMIGAIMAEFIDVALVARDSHRVAPIAPAPSPKDFPDVQLVLAPQSNGALMGLAGRF